MTQYHFGTDIPIPSQDEVDEAMSERDKRKAPDLFSERERAYILQDAERLWADLQSNDLGGFSGANRPFYILHAFKEVIERYGKRDVGLNWSKNDLDALPPTPKP